MSQIIGEGITFDDVLLDLLILRYCQLLIYRLG